MRALLVLIVLALNLSVVQASVTEGQVFACETTTLLTDLDTRAQDLSDQPEFDDLQSLLISNLRETILPRVPSQRHRLVVATHAAVPSYQSIRAPPALV